MAYEGGFLAAMNGLPVFPEDGDLVTLPSGTMYPCQASPNEVVWERHGDWAFQERRIAGSNVSSSSFVCPESNASVFS